MLLIQLAVEFFKVLYLQEQTMLLLLDLMVVLAQGVLRQLQREQMVRLQLEVVRQHLLQIQLQLEILPRQIFKMELLLVITITHMD